MPIKLLIRKNSAVWYIKALIQRISFRQSSFRLCKPLGHPVCCIKLSILISPIYISWKPMSPPTVYLSRCSKLYARHWSEFYDEVTGANRGIGLRITEVLAKRSETVIFAGVRDPGSATALKDLSTKYPNVHILKLTSGSVEDNQDAAKEIERISGQLDIVIANAGAPYPHLIFLPHCWVKAHRDRKSSGPGRYYTYFSVYWSLQCQHSGTGRSFPGSERSAIEKSFWRTSVHRYLFSTWIDRVDVSIRIFRIVSSYGMLFFYY